MQDWDLQAHENFQKKLGNPPSKRVLMVSDEDIRNDYIFNPKGVKAFISKHKDINVDLHQIDLYVARNIAKEIGVQAGPEVGIWKNAYCVAYHRVDFDTIKITVYEDSEEGSEEYRKYNEFFNRLWVESSSIDDITQDIEKNRGKEDKRFPEPHMADLIEEWDNFVGWREGSAEKENVVVKFLEEQLETLGIPKSEISILDVAAFTGMISISLYKRGFKDLCGWCKSRSDKGVKGKNRGVP